METKEEIDCEALAADVVNKTRTNVLLTKTTMTSIADRSVFNRLTISKLLDKKKGMPLRMWLAAVYESGADPCEILSIAIREQSCSPTHESKGESK